MNATPSMTDLFARLQAALGDRYTVERELAAGGMSRVFVALERGLGRRVAVKVLPPDLAAALSVERFRREIQLAASLQHPHIVPLLAAGGLQRLIDLTLVWSWQLQRDPLLSFYYCSAYSLEGRHGLRSDGDVTGVGC